MTSREVFVVYDGQCPMCSLYCHLVRIRESVGRLVLVDARQRSVLMEEITAARLDIDEGMVVKIGMQLFYGADAIHVLALMGTPHGVFNRLAYWSFRSRRASRLLYPALRSVRNGLLWLLRTPKIANLARAKLQSVT